MLVAMATYLPILLLIAMVITLGLLAVGVVGMVRRGGTGGVAGRRSNRLMRLRIVFQAGALVLFALLMLIAGGAGR